MAKTIYDDFSSSGDTLNRQNLENRFNQPMPMIGFYIAVASLICTIGITIDTLQSFTRSSFTLRVTFSKAKSPIHVEKNSTPTCLEIQKFLVPLQILFPIAIKFSMDLNATMPHRQDQLAKFCDGESDYKWSTTMVLISQTIAVGIGTIAPAVRWFMAINFSSSNKAKQACNRELGVEIYWIKKLLVWQLQPLDFKICGHHGRFLDFKRFIRCKNSISSNESELGSLTNLSRFVIHLGGEEELVDLIMKNNGDATDHWIKIGEKQKPEDLIVEKLLEKLVEKVDSSSAFTGVGEFDNDSVPSLEYVKLFCCRPKMKCTNAAKDYLKSYRS
ncbi:hypothetical protein L6452_16084 [Arctium lappa]|uniref:Uncharacterized protein n=1 Tax=Arctium lappa TaxID=4217 RepID=A0ACB9BZM0_ARCLA|nr:hypothetical protein L6452_16084 [Arctium lappa]